jgi:hypothetical protein
VGVVKRLESPIIGLKKFNNWVKSVLVSRFAHPALAASPSHATFAPKRGRGEKVGCGKVLDMGCGKGGDLPKWAKARVRELIGVGASAMFLAKPATIKLRFFFLFLFVKISLLSLLSKLDYAGNVFGHHASTQALPHSTAILNLCRKHSHLLN